MVDDGSTGASGDICQWYVQTNSRVLYLYQQKKSAFFKKIERNVEAKLLVTIFALPDTIRIWKTYLFHNFVMGQKAYEVFTNIISKKSHSN